MSEGAQFTIGSEVMCTDGTCGVLRRVVVDPVARALTHLAVGPASEREIGRLVPVDLVEAPAPQIRLRCTRAEFEKLERSEDLQFLPRKAGDWGYDGFGDFGQGQVHYWPFFPIGIAGTAPVDMRDVGKDSSGPGPRRVLSDRVPAGEVEVRRGDRVQATDGAIGHVEGLIVDPADHHITHILLAEGHLWAAKDVAIPIGSVVDVKDGVRLTLSKDQVRDLPPVAIEGR